METNQQPPQNYPNPVTLAELKHIGTGGLKRKE